jgi:CBS domain-containing protein
MTDKHPLPTPLPGSQLIPSFAHAYVRDALHLGVITCLPDTPMEAVARIMTTNHVHAVVVAGMAGARPWGVVTDRDLLEVAPDAADRSAGSCATGELVTVAPDERLEVAAELMRRHNVSHLLVVDPQRNLPVGVLSTLDIADIVAWGRG